VVASGDTGQDRARENRACQGRRERRYRNGGIGATEDDGRRRFAAAPGWIVSADAATQSRVGHNPCVTQYQPDPAPGAEPERGFLAAVLAPDVDEEEELAEARELLRTAGVALAGELVQHRLRPDPRTYVGKGKFAELKDQVVAVGAESLIVDDDLDPSQQRRLEDALRLRVIDRTQLILDIFAQHARTAEGKLQVELAQLEYNLPRMRGLWRHLERLGGGIGTRGPGEAQLETDRRLARRRIGLLKQRLRALATQRETQRTARKRAETPLVALAGYTNVGKSTLLNALTQAEVSVDDRLFETLDPTTRAFEHEGRRYLVTDTVGFIRRLPHQLVEGFAATLEETLAADLILHLADTSGPDTRLDAQIESVESVLAEIGAAELPSELVLNKIDAVDPLRRRRLTNRFPGALQVSARTGEGIEQLKARIAERFAERFEPVRLLIPHTDGARLAELYGLGAPIEERLDLPEGVLVRARLPRQDLARYARYLVADAAISSVRRR
jgi:GTPase